MLSRDPRPVVRPFLSSVQVSSTVMDLAPRRGAADRRRIQRQYQAFRVLCCAVPQRDPPAPWPATLIAPPENTAQDCRESARLRLRDRRRGRAAPECLAPRGRGGHGERVDAPPISSRAPSRAALVQSAAGIRGACSAWRGVIGGIGWHMTSFFASEFRDPRYDL